MRFLPAFALLLFLAIPNSQSSTLFKPRHLSVRTTAYTHTESDHLIYGRKNAIGTRLRHDKNYHSAAADWSRFPLGTKFKMKGSSRIYVIDDYGSALVGTDTIDIYHLSKKAMWNWGVRHVDIEIIEHGSFEKSAEILSQRTKYSHVRKMLAGIKKPKPSFFRSKRSQPKDEEKIVSPPIPGPPIPAKSEEAPKMQLASNATSSKPKSSSSSKKAPEPPKETAPPKPEPKKENAPANDPVLLAESKKAPPKKEETPQPVQAPVAPPKPKAAPVIEVAENSGEESVPPRISGPLPRAFKPIDSGSLAKLIEKTAPVVAAATLKPAAIKASEKKSTPASAPEAAQLKEKEEVLIAANDVPVAPASEKRTREFRPLPTNW